MNKKEINFWEFRLEIIQTDLLGIYRESYLINRYFFMNLMDIFKRMIITMINILYCTVSDFSQNFEINLMFFY